MWTRVRKSSSQRIVTPLIFCTLLQVAMVTYSLNATLEWCFNDPQTSSKETLENAIANLQLQDYFNNIVEAIEIALDCIESPILSGDR